MDTLPRGHSSAVEPQQGQCLQGASASIALCPAEMGKRQAWGRPGSATAETHELWEIRSRLLGNNGLGEHPPLAGGEQVVGRLSRESGSRCPRTANRCRERGKCGRRLLIRTGWAHPCTMNAPFALPASRLPRSTKRHQAHQTVKCWASSTIRHGPADSPTGSEQEWSVPGASSWSPTPLVGEARSKKDRLQESCGPCLWLLSGRRCSCPTEPLNSKR